MSKPVQILIHVYDSFCLSHKLWLILLMSHGEWVTFIPSFKCTFLKITSWFHAAKVKYSSINLIKFTFSHWCKIKQIALFGKISMKKFRSRPCGGLKCPFLVKVLILWTGRTVRSILGKRKNPDFSEKSCFSKMVWNTVIQSPKINAIFEKKNCL